jgi:hypothetical protein
VAAGDSLAVIETDKASTIWTLRHRAMVDIEAKLYYYGSKGGWRRGPIMVTVDGGSTWLMQ